MSTVTPEVLHQLLDYNPDTGALTWKARGVEWFTNLRQCRSWNTRFSGKPAGTLNVCSGYRIVAVLAQYIYAHRVAYAMHNGTWPEVTDHINGVRDDNRAVNLRSVSDAENKKNLKRPAHNSSGVIGVYWDQANEKWCAQITVSGRKRNLGRFDTIEGATAARDEANDALGFHANHGRSATL